MKIFLVFSLFLFSLLTNVYAFNEKLVREKYKHDPKDAKLEYYSGRQFDHPDADADTIQKHGASMEDAKMQADGLSEPKIGSKKVKKVKEVANENQEARLQELAQGEERHGPKRRHHRHEIKAHEEAKSTGILEEKISNKNETKEKKVLKTNKRHQIVESDSEETRIGDKGGSKSESVSHSKHGKRTHDKKKKGHKHASPVHKTRKHGGKKQHKQSKDKKAKKARKSNHN